MNTEPDPYAPAKAHEPPQPPRPAGRPAVFLWAIFAFGLSVPSRLWAPFVHENFDDRLMVVYFQQAGLMPALLGLLWAYLTDRFPLLGWRREGYLLLSSAILAAAWVAAPFVPVALRPWMALHVVLGVALALGNAATHGGLIELGRRHAETGRLAAAAVGLSQLVGLAFEPIELALRTGPLGWSAGVGAALAVSIALVVILSEERSEAPAPAVSPGAAGLGAFLRSRTFWAALAFVAGVATLTNVVERLETVAANFVPVAHEVRERQDFLAGLAFMAATAAYLLLCRSARAGTLIRASMIAQALACLLLVTHEGAFAETPVVVARAFSEALGRVAVVHLVFRAAPQGREACGYMLLMGAPIILSTVVSTTLVMAQVSLPVLAVAGAAGLLLAALAVGALPASLVAGRDGDAPPPAREPTNG